MKTNGYAARSAKEPLAPWSFERRATGARDVAIDVLFCGVCHSDLHTVRSEWPGTVYPCVPGHEIVGRVVEAGKEVTRFAAGGLAAVGCIVDSCRACASCRAGLEQFCDGMIGTYNSPDSHTGAVTYGGYSKRIVVDQDYVLRVPEGLDPAAAAPLLCAGITTYSPLRHWKAGKGKRVGIVGLGGLGHMGVKLAHAMGAEVVLFTTSPGKRDDAHDLEVGGLVDQTARVGPHEVLERDTIVQASAQVARRPLVQHDRWESGLFGLNGRRDDRQVQTGHERVGDGTVSEADGVDQIGHHGLGLQARLGRGAEGLRGPDVVE